jgi:hypothetical protein
MAQALRAIHRAVTYIAAHAVGLVLLLLLFEAIMIRRLQADVSALGFSVMAPIRLE